MLILNASTPSEIDAAFATLRQRRAGALLVGGDPFFTSRRQQIVALAARDAIPDMYVNREFVAAGGLMSYGSDTVPTRIARLASTSGGFSRARSPPTCRSMQPTKFELVINLKTAKALGLDSAAHASRPRRRGDRMKRREFITLLGGAAAAWPLAARAQQPERMRRIGVLLPAAADDPEYQARVGAFLQGLQQLGWTIGRNVRIDTRWADGQCRPTFADTRRNWSRSRRTSSWPMAARPWGRC